MRDPILDRYKTATGGVQHRGDLFVCDTQKLDFEKCAALIAYNKDLGCPKVSDVYNFARETWGNKIVPQIESLKDHPQDACLSVVLAANLFQRPVADAERMRKITSSTFAEDKSGTVWSLVTGTDGTRTLVMNVDEDITAMVASVSRRNVFNEGAKFASMKTAAPFVDVGDSVKFFGPKNQALFGVVSSVDGDTVVIKTKNDGVSHTVSRYAICEVVSKGKGYNAKEQADLTDFFATIWGSRELAEQFTERDVNDGVIQDTIPTFNGR